uniref:Uncharacterized protein n=1 Tax=Anguilla anguilla TaxID=7936 RepID=A0A0E9WBA7_ANGAN
MSRDTTDPGEHTRRTHQRLRPQQPERGGIHSPTVPTAPGRNRFTTHWFLNTSPYIARRE